MTNDFDELTVIPKSKFVEVHSQDVDANIDGITRFNVREFNPQVVNRYRMIVINEALAAQGKDVAEAQKRLRDTPGAE